MALSENNKRRLDQVRAALQMTDPSLTTQVLESHPSYPSTETGLGIYLGNCALGHWSSGDVAEQARRSLARAAIFLRQVIDGVEAQTEMATIKDTY